MSAGAPWSGLCPHLPWLSRKYRRQGQGGPGASVTAAAEAKGWLPPSAVTFFMNLQLPPGLAQDGSIRLGAGSLRAGSPGALSRGVSLCATPSAHLPAPRHLAGKAPSSREYTVRTRQPLRRVMHRPGSRGQPLASGVTSLASMYLSGEREQ